MNMPFEIQKPEEKIGEITGKLTEIVDNVSTDTLERAIRFMGVSHGEKLYRAIETSKTATDDLFLK